jgi:hypothetical protein
VQPSLKYLFLAAAAGFGPLGCAETTPEAGSINKQPTDVRSQVESIAVPELQMCALEKGSVPPSKMGGVSPKCASRLTFTPSGIQPRRVGGEFAVVLKLAPPDQERLSKFFKPLVNRYAVLLRGKTVVRNYLIVGDSVTELLVTFDTEADKDAFFRALFAD